MTLRTTIKPPPLAGGDADAIARAIHGDPFSVLGPHHTTGGRVIRAFLPGAKAVEVLRRADRTILARLDESDPAGLFQGVAGDDAPYLLRVTWPDAVQEAEDPYSFGVVLGDLDLHLFSEGRHFELAEALGANVLTIDGVRGARFAVWAPNASRVAVVGDFNSWDARRHPMRLRHSAGIWELFIPRVGPALVASGFRSRRIRSRSRPKFRPRPPRSSAHRGTSAGMTRHGWKRAPSVRPWMRRSPSMKYTSARGCIGRMTLRPPRCGTWRSTGSFRT